MNVYVVISNAGVPLKEMIILIHSSKTMRDPSEDSKRVLDAPLLLSRATELATYLKELSVADIQKTMAISEKLAITTNTLFQRWTTEPSQQREAIDSFLGDIYSGLQVHQWSAKDRSYANDHLRILSGLYGIIKPLDGIFPYRLELGYKLPDPAYKNLYTFWGTSIVETLPKDEMIVDLSAVEYGKTVTAHRDTDAIITPRFLTVSPKTGEPTFVVVHAKIARGAFASWMIRNNIDDPRELLNFNEIGYTYDESLSTDQSPVFVCKKFGGLGLSVRLS